MKSMPISYTNRKGSTFFLCQGTTKTGKVRYYFARESKGKEIEGMPSGYEVSESVNGVVSLVKVRPRLIPTDEVALVEAALKRLPNGDNYRVVVKHDQVIIYEGSGPDVEGIIALFGKNIPRPAGVIGQLKAQMERYVRFTPVMRFILTDPDKRAYAAERWCYSGSIDDWINVGKSGKLEHLARKLIPTLGTDAFFELY
jgi:hypothetical protein